MHLKDPCILLHSQLFLLSSLEMFVDPSNGCNCANQLLPVILTLAAAAVHGPESWTQQLCNLAIINGIKSCWAQSPNLNSLNFFLICTLLHFWSDLIWSACFQKRFSTLHGSEIYLMLKLTAHHRPETDRICTVAWMYYENATIPLATDT